MARKFWSKSNPVYSLFSAGMVGSPVWSPFNKKHAMQLSTNVDVLYATIKMLSTACSQARFRVVRADSEGNEVDVGPEHRLSKLLARPNMTQDQSAFIAAACAFQFITGDTYINMNAGSLTKEGISDPHNFEDMPSELWLFRPDRTKIVPGEHAVAGYEYRSERSAKPKKFPADEMTGKSNVIHWKTLNPLDDFYGLSPIQAALKPLDTYEKTVDWNKSLLDNGGRPSGALFWKGEGRMTPEVQSDFKKVIEENITNKRNRGKPLVLPGNVDWKDLSMSPKDMDFLNSKTTSAKDIVRCYNVSGMLLDIENDPTYANKEAAKLGMWDDAVIPVLAGLVSMLNAHLTPRFGDDITIKLDLSDVTALEPRREKLWERASGASDYITVNEQRRMVNLEDIDGGDEIMVNASKIPLSFATTPPSLPSPTTDDSKKKD